MNYRKVYMAIIAKAIKENRKKLSKDAENYVYYEAHHILPKSLFPAWKKRKSNIVLLTAREHFFVHQLLAKIYPHSNMIFALMRLSCDGQHTSSRVYGSERIAYSKRNSELQKQKYDKGWIKNGRLYVSKSNPDYEKIKGYKPNHRPNRARSNRARLSPEEYSLSRKKAAYVAGQKHSKPIREENSGKTFKNGVEAADYFGVSKAYISNLLVGKSKSRKWRFSFI